MAPNLIYRKKPEEAFQMTQERYEDKTEWPTWLLQASQLPCWEPNAIFK